MKTPPLQRSPQHVHQPPRRQQGMVLFIALIVLVAMTLAGIGMVRSVDTTNLIAGNLAFKQGTVQGADIGIEAANQWLLSVGGTGVLPNSDNSNNNNLSKAYFSSRPGTEPDWSLEATWANQKCVNVNCSPDPVTGNVISYVIHRMCTRTGATFNGVDALNVQNECATYNPATGTAATGAPDDGASTRVYGFNLNKGGAGAGPGGSDISVYFRITTRVRGPRDTLSIVQTMVMMPE